MAARTTSATKAVGTPDQLMSIGLDIGKDVFHIVAFDQNGKIALRRKVKRFALETEFAKLPRCIVGMEACLSAHLISRRLRALGFDPRIIPAMYVKPFAKGQKNDYNDAEAALRPNLKPVKEKTQEQLDLQALSSSSFPLGIQTHRNDQPDSGLSDRAGDHRA